MEKSDGSETNPFWKVQTSWSSSNKKVGWGSPWIHHIACFLQQNHECDTNENKGSYTENLVMIKSYSFQAQPSPANKKSPGRMRRIFDRMFCTTPFCDRQKEAKEHSFFFFSHKNRQSRPSPATLSPTAKPHCTQRALTPVHSHTINITSDSNKH